MHPIEIVIYIVILLGTGIYVGRIFYKSWLLQKRMKLREIEYAKINKDAQSKDPKVVEAAAQHYIKMLNEGP